MGNFFGVHYILRNDFIKTAVEMITFMCSYFNYYVVIFAFVVNIIYYEVK